MMPGRQIVLIEVMFKLGNKRFRRMKTFVEETKREQWTTAIYSLMGGRESNTFATEFEEYVEMFRNG